MENASATRPVDALRAWLSDNISSTALPISMRRNGYGILLDQGEAARLSRVCRGLGLTVDAPRLRQAARWNYAKLISWTGQIIAADGNPSGGVQSATHRRATELLLVEHASSRMCRRRLG